ncbi:MAG: hypothetical protein JWP25_7192 [Bradyrhizobium sp.]|nr:hypothetical protein [Bradyrhizobium sp.]
MGCLGRLGARERLPEAVDRAGELSNLVRQPLCIILLCRKLAPHGLQLILDNLQLVDRLFLGRLQSLRLLHKLL